MPATRARARPTSAPSRLERALKVDAHARFGDAGFLGHAVYPVFLCPPSHHDQVAGAGLERNGCATRTRLDEESPGRAQREHRYDAFRSSTGEAIAVPAR